MRKEDLPQNKPYIVPQSYHSHPNIKYGTKNRQNGSRRGELNFESEENMFKINVPDSIFIRKGQDVRSTNLPVTTFEPLLDRVKIQSQLHVEIPDSADSRILLLSEPDTPSAVKVSDLPVIRNKNED